MLVYILGDSLHTILYSTCRGFRYFFPSLPLARAPIFSGCLHTRYLLAQFQFLRISYSLKASAEERGLHVHRAIYGQAYTWRVRASKNPIF
jgi:hypothetical protein